MNRAQRREAQRAQGRSSFRLSGEETCDRCGRHLDDGPPDAPTLSVDVGGRLMMACGHCAPALAAAMGLPFGS